ncbi:MAG: hypothetical protein KBC81_03555 [Candidatus Pacebacteria bacterium]|nr:hypothetical protein [Candidatus Paceibacterota bacterium]
MVARDRSKEWSKEEKVQYEEGYRRGFEDNPLAWWQIRKYPRAWQDGYHDGKSEIDRLVERAAERNNSLDE